ncbi:unnamed protein product [Allacma fusca]|uniref:Uncharacterized protein n=1 Tax=Allacma fusca TaxID=39272 RepID=A0A8J2JJY5_9HEXA|nr:unnamed protein product [Allacma fusca]
MFSFASKMLNTIMGTEDGQPPGPGQPPPMGMMSHQQQQPPLRPMSGFPQVRPNPQVGGPRPYGGPPQFSGPRPNPGLVRGGPPNFGGPPRPMGGPGTPHRFNGPQPATSPGMPRGMHPGGPQPGIRPGPPGVTLRPRGPGPGPFPQKTQPQLPGAAGSLTTGASGATGVPVPDVDLSHLSAEERAMIENVMAKAQQLEQEAPPAPVGVLPGALPGQPGPIRMMRPEDQLQQQGGDYGGRQCPLCRQRDVSGRDGHPGQECSECRTLVCNRCGGMATHPETKRPEWTCGNCIKRRRMGSAPNVAVTPGHQNLGPRPQLGPYSQLQSPNVDWDGGRRASIGGGIQGPGGPQQRWESEREFDNLDESKEAVGTWESDTGQTRRYSAEMTLPSQGERTEQSEELFLNPSSKSPVDLDDEPSPLTDLPPDHSLSMSTPVSASASKAKPSSFVKMHSRSISIDMAETDDEGKSSSLNNGFGMYSPIEHEGLPADTTYSSTHRISIPSLSKPDSNTDALMEELSKLQSAVESYSLKRRERQKREVETELPDSYTRLSPSPISRSRSPSPSPSPKDSPGKSGESMSPIHSLSPVYHSPQGGRDSPESPESEYPAPRKAIVMKEHDLDDYKSSTDEDTDSDSEEERKTGLGGSEVVAYYDHSPGEVYTIPEEEDEGGSPTGGDLVTSLNRPGIQGSMGENGSPRRRLVGQECVPGMSPADMRHSIRPQLRSQRSLDNRLPSSSNQQQAMDLMNQQSLDQQGNISYPNNNLNTQAPSQLTGAMDNQIMLNQSTINASNSMSGPINAPQSIGIPGTSAASMLHPQTQQQTMLSTSVNSDMQSLEMNVAGIVQRTSVQSAQQQALGQSGVGLGGGVGSDWSSNVHMSSLQCPTSGMTSVSPTDPSLVISQNQPYQQQQSTHAINPPVVQNQSQLQSQQAAAMHPSQQQQLQSQIQQQQQLQQQQLQQQQILQQQQQQHLQLQQQSQQLGAQQAQLLQQQQLQQMPQSQHSQQQQQLSPMQPTGGQLGQQDGSLHSLQQQQWPQQSHSQSQLYDQSGRPLPSSSVSQYAQLQPALGSLQSQQQQHMGMSQQHYQQQTSGQMNLMHTQQQQQQLPQSTQGPQAQHSQQLQGIGMGGQHPQGSTSHLNVSTSQAGPGAKSISGLLADFSRALGLGSTSPRPSPSEDKSEPFPIPSSAAGSGGMSIQGLPLSPYDNYSHPHQHPQQQIPHQQGVLQQHLQPSYQGYQSSQQQQHHVQQSAFASIQDSSQAFLQRQQHQSMVSQQSQQYSHSAALQQSQSSQQPVMTQGGNVMTQQQAASLGVGVVGALSPAQAHMYQQQMALQHQAQHMKKTSRRAHLSSSTVGEMRRDGGPSTVIIGGQGLAVTPSGMTIGALTPAVVTSLGTFIGGGPTLIGTSLLSQPLAGTPVGTPRSGRDPGGCDSSDTMSETDSQKSLRMRRKLPCLPADQEAAPLPSTKKRDRQRAQETFRSLSPMRMSSLDNTIPGRSYGMSSLSLSRPSASESNLRKLCMGPDLRPDPIPRPGSALGLLQASSVVSSMGAKSDTVYPLSGNLFSTSATFPGMGLRTTTSGFTASSDLTTTTSVLSGLYPSYKTSDTWSSNMAELAACLPPDLRHLLNKSEHGDISGGMSGLSGLTSSLGETSLNVGSHLPTYMRTLREQLQEERRQLLSEERRRLEALRERDRELGARLDAVTSRAASDSMRSRADLSRNVGISRSAGASPLLSRKLKGHRRQLSDPKLSLPFSPIQEDGDSELQDFERSSTGILRPPYKSYEYESLEDTTLLRPPPGEWDPSQSYLAPSWGSASVLRETAISSMGGLLDDDEMRAGVSSRFLRRSSEGEAWPPSGISRSLSSSRDKRHQLRKHRKSRSWHPSPYVSEEEDDEEEDNLSREEKKARIKAEIARRRQQIQEKAGLHNELLRISRYGGDMMQDRHSVLKSVDQLVREQYGRFDPPYQHYGRPVSSLYTTNPRLNRGLISPSASEEDRSIERIASTFRSDDYTNMLYERIGEISPLATDTESMGSELGTTPAAMPLLPDMPTRSRRLLEDLGSAPIGMTEGGRSSSSTGTNMKGKYGVSSQGLPFRTVL